MITRMKFCNRVALIALSSWALTPASIKAGPGDGIQLNHLTLSPFVSAAYNDESNPFKRPDRQNPESDSFTELTYGLNANNKTDALEIDARFWGRSKHYDTATERDADEYGMRAGVIAGSREGIAAALNVRYADIDDFQRAPYFQDLNDLKRQGLALAPDRSDASARELFDTGLLLGRDMTDKSELDLGFQYIDVAYDSSELLDYDVSKLSLEVAHQATAKSSVFLTGEYSDQNSDGFEAGAESYTLRAGLKSRATEKVRYRGSYGFKDYERTGARETSQTEHSFELRADWIASTKIIVFVNAESDIIPAADESNNAREIVRGSIGATYKMLPTVNLSLLGTAGRTDYTDPVNTAAGAIDKYIDSLGGQLLISYAPRAKFMNVFASLRYDENTSNDPNAEYDNLRATIGLNLRY
jgi:hypothetical protein